MSDKAKKETTPVPDVDLYKDILEAEPDQTNEELLVMTGAWLQAAEEHKDLAVRHYAAIAYSHVQTLVNQIMRMKHERGEPTTASVEKLRADHGAVVIKRNLSLVH